MNPKLLAKLDDLQTIATPKARNYESHEYGREKAEFKKLEEIEASVSDYEVDNFDFVCKLRSDFASFKVICVHLEQISMMN